MFKTMAKAIKTEQAARTLTKRAASVGVGAMAASVAAIVFDQFASPGLSGVQHVFGETGSATTGVGAGSVYHWAIIAITVGGLLVCGLCIAVCLHLIQRAKDLAAQNLHDRLLNGEGLSEPFSLYLRPFDSDGVIKQKTTKATIDGDVQKTVELEHVMAAALAPLGGFVALGRTMDAFGSGRIETSDKTWKQSALSLMKNANLIIMLPATNAGTLWEVQQLFEHDLLAKTILINERRPLFNLLRHRRFDQKDDWADLVDIFAGRGYTLPPFSRKGRLLCFGTSTKP